MNFNIMVHQNQKTQLINAMARTNWLYSISNQNKTPGTTSAASRLIQCADRVQKYLTLTVKVPVDKQGGCQYFMYLEIQQPQRPVVYTYTVTRNKYFWYLKSITRTFWKATTHLHPPVQFRYSTLLSQQAYIAIHPSQTFPRK